MPAPKKKKKWWKHVNVVLGVLALAAVVLVVRNLGDAKRFALLVRDARPGWLLVALGCQLVTYLCAAEVLHCVARRHTRAHLRYRSFVPLGFAKLFVDQVVPTAGIGGAMMVVRGLLARGISRPIAMAAVLVELLSFYIGHGIAVGIALVAVLAGGTHPAWVVWVCVAFGVVAVAIPSAILWLNWHGVDAAPRWLRRVPVAARFLASIGAAPTPVLRDGVQLLETSALQLAVVVLDAATLGAMLYAVGADPPWAAVFAGYTLASAVAAIGILPGGLGIFEATSVATLRMLGVPLEAGLAGTLLARGLMLWLPLLPGLWMTRREAHRYERRKHTAPHTASTR